MIFKTAKRVIIFIVGTTVLLIGVVMIAFPGPAFVVIPAGLAILATEFVWARHLLHKVKATAVGARDRLWGSPVADPPPVAGDPQPKPACGEQSNP